MEPVEVLRTRFPALEIHEWRAIEDGWDSLVLEVNGEWIFRFPRRAEVEEWVEREVVLLPELAETLPVAVPRFDLVARNAASSASATGSSSERRPAPICPSAAGEDLGRFLAALHRFPVERARALGVPCFDPAAVARALRGLLRGIA